MNMIEKGLEEVNAYIKGITVNSNGNAIPTSSSSDQAITRQVEEIKIQDYQPFAIVTSVQDGSPADVAVSIY